MLVVGIPGDQGIPGSTMWSTVGVPPNTLGNNGDWANDDVNFVFYGPKANGVWPAGNSYKGTNGTNGATWWTGSGTPSNTLGANSDLYFDEVAPNNVWQKSAGAWSQIASLKGAAGAAGAIGPRGVSDRILGAGSFYWFQNAQPVLSNGTDTGFNAEEVIILPAGGGDFRIGVSNKNGTGSITWKTSAQWPANLIPAPITWNGGASTVTLPAGGSTVWSDPFNGSGNILACPPPGTSLYLRHYVTCASGVQLEFIRKSGLGQVSGTTQTDQTGNYTFNYGTPGVAQIAVEAIVGGPLTASNAVVGVGDSIMRGEGDSVSDMGPFGYACGGFSANAVQWANAGIVGETALQFSTSPRDRRDTYIKYADKVVFMYGTNDLGYNTGLSLAQLQGYVIKAWWACGGFGAQVIGCTLLPRASTSSDNYETINGQTLYAGWGTGSTAAQFNAWMRAGAPMLNGAPVAAGTSGAITAGQSGHPLYAVCNWTAPIEAGQDTGLWIVNGTANYATSDGTHPSDAAAQLMAAVLAPLL